jgi:hypothetical protein
MKRIRALLLASSMVAVGILMMVRPADAQGIPQDIPRKELLILENPEGVMSRLRVEMVTRRRLVPQREHPRIRADGVGVLLALGEYLPPRAIRAMRRAV